MGRKTRNGKSGPPAAAQRGLGTADGAASTNEQVLRVRVTKGRAAKQGAAGRELVSRVKSAVKKGGVGQGKTTSGQHRVGRSAVALSSASTRAQRVTVKARVQASPKAGGQAVMQRHIDYIQRDGVDKDGGDARPFTAEQEASKEVTSAFADRAAEDRHSFRLIVSPENGNAMDLEQHTRDLMAKMEQDLGTKIDWLAVAHHDTDNPHVHILIRGVDDKGGDLVISRDYISNGIRTRACELATRELGYRSDLDVYQGLRADLSKTRWTGIDGQLMRQQQAHPLGLADMTAMPKSDFGRMQRDMKLARLGVLREHGLAEPVAPGRWRIAEGARESLQNMTMQTQLAAKLKPQLDGEKARSYSITDPETLKVAPVRGIVLDRGLANPLSGTEYVVLGGFDGRVHYLTVGVHAERHLEAPARVGDTVNLSTVTTTASGSADRNVLKRLDTNGVYDPGRHLAEVRGWREGVLPGGTTPEGYIDAHVKRMEALSSRGHVTALDGGRFSVPQDLTARIDGDPALNRGRAGFVRVDVEARGPLKRQAGVIAQSFLDGELEQGRLAQLQGNSARTRSQAAFMEALEARTDRLTELRLAERSPEGLRLARDLPARLRQLELEAAAGKLATQYGTYADLDAARRYQGTVAAIERLPSGLHAVIVSGDTFALVPAKQGLEKMLGKDIAIDLPRGMQLGATSFQQARIRYMAIDQLTPRKDLGLGLTR